MRPLWRLPPTAGCCLRQQGSDVAAGAPAGLLTADGDAVLQGDAPVTLDADLAVGRPPGLKPGTTLNTPIAMRLGGLTLEAGGYEFRRFIDGAPVARRPFQVLLGG